MAVWHNEHVTVSQSGSELKFLSKTLMHVCKFVCISVCLSVCKYVCTYVCMYTNAYLPPSFTTTVSLNSLLFLLKFFLLNSLLTVLLIAPVLSRSLCIVSILRGRSLPLAVVDGKLKNDLKLSTNNMSL